VGKPDTRRADARAFDLAQSRIGWVSISRNDRTIGSVALL
jgi:hypothetical protein